VGREGEFDMTEAQRRAAEDVDEKERQARLLDESQR
jgi:hypothetical protein